MIDIILCMSIGYLGGKEGVKRYRICVPNCDRGTEKVNPWGKATRRNQFVVPFKVFKLDPLHLINKFVA